MLFAKTFAWLMLIWCVNHAYQSFFIELCSIAYLTAWKLWFPPNKTTNSWEWSCSLWYHKHHASSCKSHHHILDTDLIYRPDFLLENITQLTAHWQKIKNILNKIFSNTLFEIMFLCVRIKILFIKYRYFGLNTNKCYWMQIYFLKYQILFIKYGCFFIKSKYILLNTNIFS